MDKRRSLLVASLVPYRGTNDQYWQYLENELDMPFVHPGLTDLETADGSHLNRAGAERFTKAFWKQFVAGPEVKQRLGIE